MRGGFVKCLKRNQRAFYYALYEGIVLLSDDSGFETGEREETFSNPVRTRATITVATGEVTAQQFGGNENYDRIILTDEMNCPIDEYSRLGIDVVPVIKQDGTTDTPHDYIVKKVAKSLNHISYAVSKVDVNAN